MATRRRSRKGDLLAATVRLVANEGTEAATVRAIAREAGVTDAAVYRHYRSKQDLCRTAYADIVHDMVLQKERLLSSQAPIRLKLREWIRLTFAYFDQHPDEFAYALLTPNVVPPHEHITRTRQGELFMAMIREARQAGQIVPIAPEMALCHLTALMLNVPRLIREGVIPGPASEYVDQVSAAVWRILCPRHCDTTAALAEGGTDVPAGRWCGDEKRTVCRADGDPCAVEQAHTSEGGKGRDSLE